MKARAEARSCWADPAVLLCSAGVTDCTLTEAMKQKLRKQGLYDRAPSVLKEASREVLAV